MTVPPEADSQIGGLKELKNTGGWVLGLAHFLTMQQDIELYIASTSPLVKTITFIQGEKIKYYIVPTSNGSSLEDRKQRECWKTVYQSVLPDVVHIHGTEYRHALTWLEANGSKSTVVSIQGILSACGPMYYLGMSQWDVIRNITLRDLYKGTIFREAADFDSIAKSEQKILGIVDHVIGRTQWDKSYLWALNPRAKYHFCNEILRYEFYEQRDLWSYSKCTKHQIFVSQASVPYKGLHQLLKAMPLVLREYPDATIRVAGFNIIDNSLKRRIMRTGYGKYILELIEDNCLEDKVFFTGRLNASEMIKEYLKCNAFVLPSSIENSPNALGEAQLLGVPCVASRVGGVPDLMNSIELGKMYRFSDPIELAYSICQIFEESTFHDPLSERAIAQVRHNPETNCLMLLSIYRSICSS